MSTFRFETITNVEALGITGADSLTFGTGSARETTVLFVPGAPDTVTVALGPHAVSFGAEISAVSSASHISFPDGSILYVGTSVSDTPPAGGAGDDAYFGGAGNDTLDAGGGANLLQGNAGNDVLRAGAGNDTIYGGQGQDQITTGDGRDFAQGNKGDDTITGGIGSDTLLGGQGDDQIEGGGATSGSFLNGNLGNDSITSHGVCTVFGEAGDDTLNSRSGWDSLSGGPGDDVITGGGAETISGDDGNDNLRVTGNDNLVSGGVGDDTIQVDLNNNTVSGDAGADRILDYGGFNVLDGGDGNDVINYQAQDASGRVWDKFFGGNGDDIIFDFGHGSDTVDGGPGNDEIHADRGGLKLILGGDGDDHIYVGSDSMTTFGGAGDDFIVDTTSVWSSEIHGGSGNDFIRIGAQDTAFGDDGNDTFEVGGSVVGAVLQGGAGADVFKFTAGMNETRVVATITDWESQDHIQLQNMQTVTYHTATAVDLASAITQASNMFFQGQANVVGVQIGGDAYLFVAGSDSRPGVILELTGRAATDIGAGTFILS